jgi:hypothetical protein
MLGVMRKTKWMMTTRPNVSLRGAHRHSQEHLSWGLPMGLDPMSRSQPGDSVTPFAYCVGSIHVGAELRVRVFVDIAQSAGLDTGQNIGFVAKHRDH